MNLTTANRVINKIEAAGVTPATRIDSLGLDSLDFLQLVVDLDKEFNTKVDIEKAAMCETVEDLVRLVEADLASVFGSLPSPDQPKSV